jgi:hypothetical protein
MRCRSAPLVGNLNEDRGAIGTRRSVTSHGRRLRLLCSLTEIDQSMNGAQSSPTANRRVGDAKVPVRADLHAAFLGPCASPLRHLRLLDRR